MLLPPPPPRASAVVDLQQKATQTWMGYFRKIWQRLTPATSLSPITPTGSPFTYTNASGQLQLVWITGGTVSAVSVAGSSVSPSAGLYPVPNDQAIVITYSVAPTIQVVSV